MTGLAARPSRRSGPAAAGCWWWCGCPLPAQRPRRPRPTSRATSRAASPGAVVGEVGRSAEVGVRVEVGVSALVRVGCVGSVVVSLGDSVTLGAGRVPERSVEGRVADSPPPSAPQPLSPTARPITSPANKPALAAWRPRTSGPRRRSLLVGMIGREAILDIRIGGPPPGERAGWGSSRQERPPFLGVGPPPASPKAGENLAP